MSSFGDRIREARKAVGLSQEGLARAADTSVMTISRYERGQIGAPRSPVLMRIAKATNVSVHWLATGEQDPGGSPALADPAHWAEFLERYDHLSELTAEELSAMKRFAGRTHRINSWYDWVQLAEWLRNRQPSPTFEGLEDD